MRLFIAIDLSPEFKQELARLQSELKKSNADVKWVEPENVHLTLKFLGEVTKEYADKVKKVLDSVASQFKSFEISLSGIGAFPKLDYPRVVWVGIAKGKDQAKKISEKLDEELSKLGFAKEEREFAAHLTIGRVRSAKNKESLKTNILSLDPGPLPLAPQQVSTINLYQSTLTPKGPIYTCLYQALLK